MSIFKKDNYADVTTEENTDVEGTQEEESMETKVGFVARHKKGLIAAGVGLLALIGVGVAAARRGSDDFDDYDDDLGTDDTPSDAEGSADTDAE